MKARRQRLSWSMLVVLSKRIGNRVKGILGHSGTCWLKNRHLTEASDFGGLKNSLPLGSESKQ